MLMIYLLETRPRAAINGFNQSRENEEAVLKAVGDAGWDALQKN